MKIFMQRINGKIEQQSVALYENLCHKLEYVYVNFYFRISYLRINR